MNDLSALNPERVGQMNKAWESWASKMGVKIRNQKK
jgi:hypothetical protein